ncbi:hypothetical protein ACFQRB_05390 [Halobaculum litoreum]|uniref:ABC transmembrane type-1 domain-containing protein n=1 Tax=Halobaculum litoreum TaxID=3031998 RepID=A0ABD5XRK0_9EURY
MQEVEQREQRAERPVRLRPEVPADEHLVAVVEPAGDDGRRGHHPAVVDEVVGADGPDRPAESMELSLERERVLVGHGGSRVSATAPRYVLWRAVAVGVRRRAVAVGVRRRAVAVTAVVRRTVSGPRVVVVLVRLLLVGVVLVGVVLAGVVLVGVLLVGIVLVGVVLVGVVLAGVVLVGVLLVGIVLVGVVLVGIVLLGVVLVGVVGPVVGTLAAVRRRAVPGHVDGERLDVRPEPVVPSGVSIVRNTS